MATTPVSPFTKRTKYVLDSTLMLIALALSNIVHPGRVMPGKESHFPSRKERMAMGKENVKGRMAGELPLHEYGAREPGARTHGQAERGAEGGKVGEAAVSNGCVRKGER